MSERNLADATHPTDRKSGLCPECYSKGYEEAEGLNANLVRVVEKLLRPGHNQHCDFRLGMVCTCGADEARELLTMYRMT